MPSVVQEKRHNFLGLAVDSFTSDDALAHVMELARTSDPSSVVFLNIDVMVKADRNSKLATAINASDLSLMDGMPPLWLARKMGIPLPEKVSGSDFVPRVCDLAANEGLSIFILGGAEGVPERACDNLSKQNPTLRVVGTYSPKIGFEHDEAELAHIDEMVSLAKPDILLVCLSCPKQEIYVAEHKSSYRAPLSISCGAMVDFLAGNIKRAPVWMSHAGIEWFWRFLKEPKRLFKRYFIDSWHFLSMVRRSTPQERGGVR